MGNSNQARRLQDDFDVSALRGQSITFHSLHSDSISISCDNRAARRTSSFRGICFSNRPICIGERVYIKITDVTSSSQPVGRDGVLRVGLLSDNPSLLNTADLPTYACPDITYEQGYWAKAVPEHLARLGNVLFFFVTTNGDVMYGVNGKEIGVFFGGVHTDLPLWALMDLYGSTSSVELVDGMQIGQFNSYSPAPADTSWPPPSTRCSVPNVAPFYPASQPMTPAVIAPAWPSASMSSLPIINKASSSLPAGQALLEIIDPMQFHLNSGRNIFFSHNRTVASRGQHDYCNGYVFTNRPVAPGEKLVISILSFTNEYSGGLAFGMTSCNPAAINELTLPDDSDLLLDFPDYWVVHKDVYTKPAVNDELTFHVTVTGEVRYSKNGHHVGTLMHVDTSLPLWAFFDIYGSTQQIRSLGIITPVKSSMPTTSDVSTGRHQHTGLPVGVVKPFEVQASAISISETSRVPTALMSTSCHSHIQGQPYISTPNSSFTSVARVSDGISTLSFGGSNVASRTVVDSGSVSRRHSYADSPAPALPPKKSQNRSLSITTRTSSPMPVMSVAPWSPAPPSSTATPSSPLDLVLAVSDVPLLLPPPLIPIPGKINSETKPDEKPAKPAKPRRRTPRKIPEHPSTAGFGSHPVESGEAGQECVVCMERATDCALYTCGHMCMCYDCAVDIVRNQSGLCPICRVQIRDIIKIFRS